MYEQVKLSPYISLITNPNLKMEAAWPPKLWFPITKLKGATTQKTATSDF